MDENPTDPWHPDPDAYPRGAPVQTQLEYLLQWAVLAPSGHNTQPWLFEVQSHRIRLFADRRRALAVVDPDDRELTMSCGAALLCLRVAAARFGWETTTTLLPDADDPDLLAQVDFRAGAVSDPQAEALFTAITRRRTNRGPYAERPVPDAQRRRLQDAAATEGVRLHLIDGTTEKVRLAELIAEGDRIQGHDRHFRRELAAWLHPNRSDSRDGLPGYAFGVPDLLSYAGPLLIRRFDWGNGQAARDQALAQGSPLLALFETAEDTPREWLRAGQALCRTLLIATAEGIAASFLNQPVEVPTLRVRLRERLTLAGSPQLLLRLGYGEAVRPTPRRPLREVLLGR